MVRSMQPVLEGLGDDGPISSPIVRQSGFMTKAERWVRAGLLRAVLFRAIVVRHFNWLYECLIAAELGRRDRATPAQLALEDMGQWILQMLKSHILRLLGLEGTIALSTSRRKGHKMKVGVCERAGFFCVVLS